MEEKKRTIVMFGDSLTDYFPMEKLKDIDAQFINSGVAGDTIAEMGARLAYDVFPYKPDIIIMQGGANDFLMSLYPGARVLAERLIRLARGFGSNCQIQRFILNLCIRHIPKGLD